MFMLLLCQTDALPRTKYLHETSQRKTNIKHFKFGGMVYIFGDEPTQKKQISHSRILMNVYVHLRIVVHNAPYFGDIRTHAKTSVFWIVC